MSRRLGFLMLGLVGLLAVASACKQPSAIIEPSTDERGTEPDGRSPTPAKPRTPVVQDGATVLLDAGAKPRTQLRYQPRIGDVVRWTRALRTDGFMTLYGERTPNQSALELDLETEVVAINEAAQQHEYLTTFVDMRLVMDQVDPTLIEDSLAPLRGLVWWTRTNARGQPLESGYIRNGSPVDRAEIESLMSSPATIIIFPEEPIGVGARWQDHHEITQLGSVVMHTNEHRLVRREGDRLEIETTTTQEPLTGMPGEVEILEFEATGSGTSTLDLGMPFPIEEKSSLKLDADVLMIISPSHEVQMTMDMTLWTAVSRHP